MFYGFFFFFFFFWGGGPLFSFNWLFGIYNSQLFFGFYVLDCLKASSLRQVIFLQKLFKSTYL